ncbi:MAG: hypothetical protein ACWGNI_02285 [Desulfobacterales bacterium]
MKRIVFNFFWLTLSLLLIVSCATVPITGRNQLSLISNNTMLSFSEL